MKWYFSPSWYWQNHLSKIKNFYSNWFLVFAIQIALLLILNKIWIIFSIIIFLLLFSLLLIKWNFLIIAIFISFLVLFLWFFVYYPENNKIDINGQFLVKEKLKTGIIIEFKQQRIFINTKNEINLNSIVQIKGIANYPQNKTDFDFVNYLKSKKVFYIIEKPKELLLISNGKEIQKYIENYFLINSTKIYQDYIFFLLLGKNINSNSDFINLLNRLNILHLFVISGFHVGIFYKILLWIFKKSRHQNDIAFIFFCVIGFLYLFLINFRLSTLRAYIFFIIVFINKKWFYNYLTKIEILAITALIFLLHNIFVIFDSSFIFSFVILFFIFLAIKIKFYKKSDQQITIALVAYFSANLLNIFFNKEINIWGFINNLIFTPIILISFFMSFTLFWWKDLMNIYFLFLDKIFLFFDKFSLMLNFSFLTKEMIVVIYFLMAILFFVWEIKTKNRKNIFYF
ncbi:MAG0480 family ComEC-like protein [Mycoplasma iguanae]|uniref:MAG0480 family ComEC-like protein n=1 Tax=Mycoplasma iguanae TaxID=292461 RepID=UPI00358E8C1B